jgi:hypothetical protein
VRTGRDGNSGSIDFRRRGWKAAAAGATEASIGVLMFLVGGVEDQAELPLLQGQAIDVIGVVEERFGQERAVPVDDPDTAGPLDDRGGRGR